VSQWNTRSPGRTSWINLYDQWGLPFLSPWGAFRFAPRSRRPVISIQIVTLGRKLYHCAERGKERAGLVRKLLT
jgi:hypothetical protein